MWHAPSSYMLAKRPLLLAILVGQVALLIISAVVMDELGIFVLMFLLMFGWCSKEHMNIDCICAWGLVCFTTSFFDIYRFIDSCNSLNCVHASNSLQIRDKVFLISLLAFPLVSLPGAHLACCMYRSIAVNEITILWPPQPSAQDVHPIRSTFRGQSARLSSV